MKPEMLTDLTQERMDAYVKVIREALPSNQKQLLVISRKDRKQKGHATCMKKGLAAVLVCYGGSFRRPRSKRARKPSHTKDV